MAGTQLCEGIFLSKYEVPTHFFEVPTFLFEVPPLLFVDMLAGYRH